MLLIGSWIYLIKGWGVWNWKCWENWLERWGMFLDRGEFVGCVCVIFVSGVWFSFIGVGYIIWGSKGGCGLDGSKMLESLLVVLLFVRSRSVVFIGCFGGIRKKGWMGKLYRCKWDRIFWNWWFVIWIEGCVIVCFL